ncbi:MAG: hypothetical protein WBS24_10185 [Terriglobales bacterium]
MIRAPRVSLPFVCSIVSSILACLVFACSTLAAAQTASSKSAPASKPAPASKTAPDEQLYRNATFGFRYKIPYGWVERTQQMRERDPNSVLNSEKSESPDSASDDAPDAAASTSSSSLQNSARKASAKAGTATKPQGDLLLAVFERPPNAPGDTINSAVVIASEVAAAYPGLKKAEDYLGPLSELTTAKGFKSDGDPDVIEIDSRQLIRADFSKAITDKLTMRQSTLILLAKGQILSFTFIAGSEDEIDDLIEALHFTATKSGAR